MTVKEVEQVLRKAWKGTAFSISIDIWCHRCSGSETEYRIWNCTKKKSWAASTLVAAVDVALKETTGEGILPEQAPDDALERLWKMRR